MCVGVFGGGYECGSYGTYVYAGLLPICVFSLGASPLLVCILYSL